jgi:hypothetical protein
MIQSLSHMRGLDEAGPEARPRWGSPLARGIPPTSGAGVPARRASAAGIPPTNGAGVPARRVPAPGFLDHGPAVAACRGNSTGWGAGSWWYGRHGATSRTETPLDVPAASLYPIADLMPGCNGNGMRPRRGIRANDVAPPEPSSRGPVPDDASTRVAPSIRPRKPLCPRTARRRARSPPDSRHRTPMGRAATGMVAGAGDPPRRAPRPLELKE